VHDSDVMIAISLRPYRRYTLEVAAPFVAAGGSLVLVTDSATAPLVPYASEAVVIAARPPGTDVSDRLHPETPAASPAAVWLVLDILTALSSASAKGAQRRLAERERLAVELGLYLG
jgi:DNA-binding MurR/RpiR family transcriptional regulator